ncbi:charged multivesicular body protein 4c-like, partial [Cetorhinus maximus]
GAGGDQGWERDSGGGACASGSGPDLPLVCVPTPAALQALKRKKRYDQQLTQIDGTLSTIEFQREALENATTNTEVLKTMSDAAKAMKTAHQNMDIDKVDDLMSEINEQQELAQEISDAISRPVGFGDDVDEVRKTILLFSLSLSL